MEFNILGPLEVLHEEERLRLGGIHQRAVLGFLLLHANAPVVTGNLSEALWGGNEPVTAQKILQNAVHGLRRVLEPGNGRLTGTSHSLRTRHHAYLFELADDCLDLTRYSQLAIAGRDQLAAGAWEDASCSLGAALGLWRGRALADLTEAGMVWPEVTALEEDRWEVLADRITADLMLGRHAEVMAELNVVTAAEPTRERLCAQLMLALYQSDRQAEALEGCRRARLAILDEFDTPPGRELRELEAAVLSQSLDLSSPTAAARLFAGRPRRSPDEARPDLAPVGHGPRTHRPVPGAGHLRHGVRAAPAKPVSSHADRTARQPSLTGADATPREAW